MYHMQRNSSLIVNSATEAAKLKSPVVVGKDTDLLMLLIHGVQLSDHSVFFTSDEKSNHLQHLSTHYVFIIKYNVGQAKKISNLRNGAGKLKKRHDVLQHQQESCSTNSS